MWNEKPMHSTHQSIWFHFSLSKYAENENRNVVSLYDVQKKGKNAMMRAIYKNHAFRNDFVRVLELSISIKLHHVKMDTTTNSLLAFNIDGFDFPPVSFVVLFHSLHHFFEYIFGTAFIIYFGRIRASWYANVSTYDVGKESIKK